MYKQEEVAIRRIEMCYKKLRDALGGLVSDGHTFDAEGTDLVKVIAVDVRIDPE